jgi:YidC/Oxa1 family membrane protein insertase
MSVRGVTNCLGHLALCASELCCLPCPSFLKHVCFTHLTCDLTLVLSLSQMESTVSMQALAPRVKEIQDRYKGRPQDEMQIEVARLYKEAGVNPLAGCLPTLVTLPVWIGLYRCGVRIRITIFLPMPACSPSPFLVFRACPCPVVPCPALA